VREYPAAMRGAVAAGHPLTAEAGARVLAEGGNAVDACIAAGFASWVAESPLTGPGGGGFMLVHRARDRTDRVLDFFVTVPGIGSAAHELHDMDVVDVEFTPESSQVFKIGAASCAVPGAVLGLEAAHRAYGTLPWRELARPAAELARRGLELNRAQAYLHAILDLILRHLPEGQRMYGKDGERLVAGDVLRMPELADTIERIAEGGAAELHGGELGRALADHVQSLGGEITLRDLIEFRVVRRRPVRAPYRGAAFVSNPPPSTGGVLIGYALRLLDLIGADGAPGSAEAMCALVEVMREQTRARGGSFVRDLYRGGLVGRLFDERTLREAAARVEQRAPGLSEVHGPGGTTHISVADARGNAAALSVSTGSGSGVIVPGTGIHLNNMLGEFDLAVAGGSTRPGARFTSMMSPSIVVRDGRPRLVVGSAGSLRLRGAVMQVVINVVGHGLPVEEAVSRPRLHYEEPQVHCEGGNDPAELDRLEAVGYDLVRWRRRNLYFGGTSAVELRDDGTLAAAGDPRRGGAGIVVG
jgi:gamma-glutamyltranspeptidase/glutathione hydrolase